jgi:hypothetical protein
MRVNLSPRGQQPGQDVGIPPAQVDAIGRFTITGVGPGRYSLNANIAGGGGVAGRARARRWRRAGGADRRRRNGSSNPR